MSNRTKRIVILDEVELRKTLSRLTSEIIEKVKIWITSYWLVFLQEELI